MRVLVEGAGFVNKGSEAMLRTVQFELGQRLRNASFNVERSMLSPGTENHALSAGIKILGRERPSTLLGRTRIRLQEVLRAPTQVLDVWRERAGMTGWATLLGRIDAVIDISGYRYADSWGAGGARRIAPIVYHAWRTGKPYIFLPQAWGPFGKDPVLRDICRKNCLRSALVLVRDTQSRQHVAKLLDKPVDQVYQFPDIAFLFRDAGKEVGQRHLAELGLRSSGYPIVCVAPNMRVYERAQGFGAENVYINMLVRVCRDFLNRGTNILLIPHEINPDRAVLDDRWLCQLILLSIGRSERIAAISLPMSAEDISSMIACCELIVGSRFHAIVAALRSRIPAVAIGWSHKYDELMQDVGLGQFVLDHSNLDIEGIGEVIRMAWENREANKQALGARLPHIESAVASMFDLVADVIHSRATVSRSN